MPRSREQIRKDRYALADRLGFTVEEKRRMRDLSDEKFNRLAVNAERRLRRIEPIDRSPRVQQRLRALQDYRRERREEPVKVRKITEPKSVRKNNFNRWSKERNFPAWARREIRDINRAAGFGPMNSYGFRVWFYIYTERESFATSRRRFNSERYERRDT